MHLSSVDLPEPFRPRIPSVSPRPDFELDVIERPEVLVTARAGVQHPLFQRGVFLLVEAEALRDGLDVDRRLQGAHSSSAKLPSTLPKTSIATRKRRTEPMSTVPSTAKNQPSA